MIQNQPYDYNASIGIRVFPNNGTDATALMKRADVAMYHAKVLGGGSYCFFTSGMQENALPKFEIEQSLQNAIE